MSISFDIQLQPKDLFRFNMRQTYTTMQGPISIILAILVFVMAGISFGRSSILYGILYIAAGVIFIFYIPISLWLRAKRTIQTNAVLSKELHYIISEQGVKVTQGEEEGELPWEHVYKVISTKHQVLIYSTRVNAYIIPKNLITEQYDKLKELMEKNLDKYRIRMK